MKLLHTIYITRFINRFPYGATSGIVFLCNAQNIDHAENVFVIVNIV